MGQQEDLTKMDRNVKEAEAQLNKLKGDILALTKEIDRLVALQNHLQENVSILRKNKIVAIATEFKKAKEDLRTATNRIKLLDTNRENSRAAHKRIEKIVDKIKKDYDKLLRSIENNVVSGKFGSSNNGPR